MSRDCAARQSSGARFSRKSLKTFASIRWVRAQGDHALGVTEQAYRSAKIRDNLSRRQAITATAADTC